MAEPCPCLVCGRNFVPPGSGRHVYCKRCKGRADRSIGGTVQAQCKVCGSAFAAASRAFCYCSDECRLEARRRRGREHLRRKREDPRYRIVAAARVRASHARRRGGGGGAAGEKEQRRPPIAAEADGGSGSGSGGGRASNGAPTTRSIACAMCGRGFVPRGRGAYAYCKRCMDKANRDAAKVPTLKCRECGKAFTAAVRQSRYCSDGCRAAGARRVDRNRYLRRMADPEERARVAARTRAWRASKKGREE